MLYSGVKNKAFDIHAKAASKYNGVIDSLKNNCEKLYHVRKQSVIWIEEIETLINSIANTPKKFETDLALIKTERVKFRETEDYASEAYKNAIKSGVTLAVGIVGATAFVSMVPTGAMAVATTFGVASI